MWVVLCADERLKGWTLPHSAPTNGGVEDTRLPAWSIDVGSVMGCQRFGSAMAGLPGRTICKLAFAGV